MNKIQSKLLVIAFIIFAFAQIALAQTTTFTYQGRLTDSSAQANGTYDFEFALFDQETGGALVVSTSRNGVSVVNGVFTVTLDFDTTPFPGADRFLQIRLKRPAAADYTTLTPRQPITSTPYAIQSLNATNAATAMTATTAITATTALNAQQLGGSAASNYVQTTDTRLADSRTPTAGSSNYIQNGTTTQSSSNFRISGTGAANVFNAATQFNIGGNRVLSVVGGSNLLVGTNAGTVHMPGSNNLFVGTNAGFNNATGSGNAFVGTSAGTVNTTGIANVALGDNANFGAGDLTNATAVGSGAIVRTSNTIALGRENGSDAVRVFGGISLNDSRLRLRVPTDDSHSIFYNSSANGIEFRAFDDFIWSSVRSNDVVMQLYSDGDLAIGGGYRQFSDARYKTNVQTFPGALDAIRRLRGVTFNWQPELNKDSESHIGFIAQEVETVLPELVSTGKDGYKSVSYSNAVPVLVEAVKEQQMQIEAQNRQIERQQKQLDELKAIVCAIKSDAAVCKIEDK